MASCDAYVILKDGRKFGPYVMEMNLRPDWTMRGTLDWVNRTGEKVVVSKAIFNIPNIGAQVFTYKQKLRPHNVISLNYTLNLYKQDNWLDCKMLEDAEVLSQLPICNT